MPSRYLLSVRAASFFILVLAVFFSPPATIFQQAVGLRFPFFFFFVAFVFLCLSSCSFVSSSPSSSSFHFFFLSLPPSLRFFFPPLLRAHRSCFGISLPRSPRHFSLYRRPSADGLEGPTMPARESSVMFAVFSRVGVTCSDGRPTFHVCFIFFSDTLFLIFSRRLRHVSVNVMTDDA